MEPTDHHDHLVAVRIPLRQGPAEAVVMEVPDQVSGLLPVVADPQVLSPAEADRGVVAPVVVHPEVEEETRIIRADFLIQIITKNEKVV